MTIGEFLFLTYGIIGVAIGLSWPVWLYFLFV